MKNLTARESMLLIGKVYHFDYTLYSQIKNELLSLKRINFMLEEVLDETVKAYLLEKKGEVVNEILRYTDRTSYPDYSDNGKLETPELF